MSRVLVAAVGGEKMDVNMDCFLLVASHMQEHNGPEHTRVKESVDQSQWEGMLRRRVSPACCDCDELKIDVSRKPKACLII
jgi:hypothetical protein